MHVARIEIENVRGFGEGADGLDLDLTDGGKRVLAGWTVFAGPNGSGKTTLLEALALCIDGPRAVRDASQPADGPFAYAPVMDGGPDWIHKGAPEATASVRRVPFVDAGSNRCTARYPVQAVARWSRDGRAELTWQFDETGGPVRGEVERWFLAAYGANRRSVGDAATIALVMEREFQRSGGLFLADAYLAESVQWIKELDYRRLAGGADASKSQYLLTYIIDLLNDGLLPEGLRVVGVTPDGIRMTHRGAELSLQSLGHGYRTTTNFVVDLVMRAYLALQEDFGIERQGDGPLRISRSGVVLIDEMELHLHPSWQKKIGFWLKDHFPNVQFLVTTHSPFICQAADTLVRLSIPDEGRPVAEIVDEATHRRVVGGGADDAVVSDLFGLEYPHSDRAEQDREELAELEAKELGGSLDPEERSRLDDLQRRLPLTPGIGVERVLRRLASDP